MKQRKNGRRVVWDEDREIIKAVTSRRTPKPRRKNRPKKSKSELGQFVAWDGEGVTLDDGSHIYVLLMNSLGDHIENAAGLSTAECLDFLADGAVKAPHAIHVVFGGSYDANMILGDLNRETLAKVWAGENDGGYGVKIGRGFRVRYTPRKQLWVARFRDPPFVRSDQGESRPNWDTMQLWDVFGFFQASFVRTLEKWLPDYPDLEKIRAGKARRGEFAAAELAETIIPYTTAELDALVRLMEKLHAACLHAGIMPRRWDGAGALAAEILRQRDVKAFGRPEEPGELGDAIRRAYFGGRIETFQYGHHAKSVYHADLRSAYPSAMAGLPCLAHGSWRRAAEVPRAPAFGLWHVRWNFTGGASGEADASQAREEVASAKQSRADWTESRRQLFDRLRAMGGVRPSADWPDLPRAVVRRAGIGLDEASENLLADTRGGQPLSAGDVQDAESALYRQLLAYASQKPPVPPAPTLTEDDPYNGQCIVGPLPWRYPGNRDVFFPAQGEGWYWWPEVDAALASLDTHPLYTLAVLDGYVWRPECKHVPFGWVPDLYRQRAEWKRAGNPAELPLKLALNSLYGKMAQQVGYNPDTGRRPPNHQLAWAGYVTSHTRAKLYRAAMQDERMIIQIATDGIFATEPLQVDEGTDLGQWEVARHDWITMVQSGVYWTESGSYSRGYDKPDSSPSSLDRERIIQGWRHHEQSLSFSNVRFIGMGTAVTSAKAFRRWRRWLDVAGGGRRLGLTMAGTKRRDVVPWWEGGELTPAAGLVRSLPNYTFSDECSAPYPMLWELEDEVVGGVPVAVIEDEEVDSGL